MVSGHLQVKKGYYYVVLNYHDDIGKRHTKYFSTGLPQKGNSSVQICCLRIICCGGWTL